MKVKNVRVNYVHEVCNSGPRLVHFITSYWSFNTNRLRLTWYTPDSTAAEVCAHTGQCGNWLGIYWVIFASRIKVSNIIKYFDKIMKVYSVNSEYTFILSHLFYRKDDYY